jgi:regulatory protein
MDPNAKRLDELMSKAAVQRRRDGPIRPKDAKKVAKEALRAAREAIKKEGKQELAGPREVRAPSRARPPVAEADGDENFTARRFSDDESAEQSPSAARRAPAPRAADGARSSAPREGRAAVPASSAPSAGAAPRSPADPRLAASKNLMDSFLRNMEAAKAEGDDKTLGSPSGEPASDLSKLSEDDAIAMAWGETSAKPSAESNRERAERPVSRQTAIKRAQKAAEEAGELFRSSSVPARQKSEKPALTPEEALAAARRKGVDLLSRSDLPAAELRKRISRDERLAPFAEKAVAQLIELGLQSDERYANGRARVRMAHRSRAHVERELSQAGLPADMIALACDQALASHGVESDTDLLARALARRFGPRQPRTNAERDKQARWFVSRGYSFDQIKTVWSMARQGLLDVWAAASWVEQPESELDGQTDSGETSGAAGAAAAPSEAEASDDAARAEREARSRGRGGLGEIELAELAIARARKFGEAAPGSAAQKAKETRWLASRGASFDQIKEIWTDAENEERARQEATASAMATAGSSEGSSVSTDWPSADSFGEENDGGSSFSRQKSGGSDEQAEQAWLKKFKGQAPSNDKERSRQAGWAARQGIRFEALRALWTRAKDGEFDA